MSLFVLLTFVLSNCPAYADREYRKIDVVSVTWSGATSLKSSVESIIETVKERVNPLWISFTQLQNNEESTGIYFTVGAWLDSPIVLSAKIPCDGAQSMIAMRDVQRQFYEIKGIRETRGRHLVILVPKSDCIWMGKASIGNNNSKTGIIALQDTSSAFVLAHEIGHTLGLGHSNLLRCDTGMTDGPWSQRCRALEYGGAIDVMGNVETTSPLSTYHQWRIGLLGRSEIKQSWLNETIELTASDVFGGTRAIFIRDGTSSYWIEYRRPRSGVSYNPGLVFFRVDPPAPSFVDSPSPEDRVGTLPNASVSEDFWMLNLDSYEYSFRGTASGSMTLMAGRSTRLFSGNILVEAIGSISDDRIQVKITRKPDVTAPPVPTLTPISSWQYPGAEVLQSGHEDSESVIVRYEAQIDGEVIEINSVVNNDLEPTYLDPLVTRRVVQVKDLPEGTYVLSLRAIDVWGNKSSWSTPRKVTIDRGIPIVKSEVAVVGTTSSSLQISLPSIKDVGSNLCATQLVNDDGFVLQSSSLQSAPEFEFRKVGEFRSTIQTFDCLGNGVSGELIAKTNYATAEKASRTGKWMSSNLSDGALTCVGKCTASLSTSGKAFVLMGEGEATIALTGKSVAKVAASASKNLRTGAIIEVGLRKRVLRITGSNFTLAGVATVNLSITDLRESPRAPRTIDPSLTEVIQKNMSKYGFNVDDFSTGWTVLPMARGTTLDDPTLDLCSASYKSESGRQYRRQVTATKVGTPYLFLSTEVVKYKDEAAADAALAELQSNYNACVKNKGGVERDGTFVDYTFSPLPTSDAQLVNENSRILVRAQIGKGITARQLLAFYQIKGEMFTGLYVVKAGETPISDAEVKRWFDAASVMAQRLDVKFQA